MKLQTYLGLPLQPKKEEWKTSKIAREFLGGWENFEQRHAILRELSIPINKMLMEGMLKFLNKGEKITFFIPPSLQEDWGYGQTSKNN